MIKGADGVTVRAVRVNSVCDCDGSVGSILAVDVRLDFNFLKTHHVDINVVHAGQLEE